MNELVKEALKDVQVPIEFHQYVGNESTYITFFEIVGNNEEYSEDEPEIFKYHVQIDIWSIGDYTLLEKQVKKAMQEKKYIFVDEADLFEEDTKVYHKGLRYLIPLYLD